MVVALEACALLYSETLAPRRAQRPTLGLGVQRLTAAAAARILPGQRPGSAS